MAWNRPSGAPKPAPKKPSALRGLVAGLVVVALGAGIVAWLFRSGEAESFPLVKIEDSLFLIARNNDFAFGSTMGIWSAELFSNKRKGFR